MATKRNFYSVLGVDSTATPEQIRRAYRELARQLHPDMNSGTHGHSSAATSVTMAEVNQAWNVLSDPVSRREYDRSRLEATEVRRERGPSSDSYRPTTPMPPLPPARFPWRAMVAVGVLASAVVLVVNGMSDPPAPGVPDQLLEPGSCVVIDRERFAVEVSCGAPHEYVVRQFIATDRSCPMTMQSFRDRQGMGLACVDSVPTSSSVVTGSTAR